MSESTPAPNIEDLGHAIDNALSQLPHAALEESAHALSQAQQLVSTEVGDSLFLTDIHADLQAASTHLGTAQEHLLAGEANLLQYTGSIMLAGSKEGTLYNNGSNPVSPPHTFKGLQHRTHTKNEALRDQSKMLMDHFKETISTINFSSLAVIGAGRKTPKSLNEFSFIPLTPIIPIRGKSIVSMGSECVVPEGVRATYQVSGRPYLDTQCSIGLVRGDWLVAVASAGIDKDGALKIIQIQDVSGYDGRSTPTNPKGRFKTGLHDGFLWRDTLVQAWEAVGQSTHASDTLIIQSGENNRWPQVKMLSEHPGYDGVAKRMGFTYRAEDGNWVRPITDTTLQGADVPPAIREAT